MTICRMERNMPTGSKAISLPMRKKVSAGVRTGENRVETEVMVTE